MELANELSDVISRMIAEQVAEQMKILEDIYFAKAKQSCFTIVELASRWGCCNATATNILKNSSVEPISKRGRENEYSIEEAEKAKQSYEQSKFLGKKLEQKVRAM